jgi:hypothetical protein
MIDAMIYSVLRLKTYTEKKKFVKTRHSIGMTWSHPKVNPKKLVEQQREVNERDQQSL